MTIGIVIPCKNYENYLPECLASIAAQGVEARVVVVDDYSANPFAVRAAAGDADVLHLAKPSGVGIARNVGAAYVNTDLLLFLDADDTLLPGALENLRAGLADGADFAYGNYVRDGALIETPYWNADLVKRQNVASYLNVWRRDSFWKLGGYSDIPVADDWELQARAARARMYGAKINAPIFNLRVHPDSKWATDSVTYGGMVGVAEKVWTWKQI